MERIAIGESGLTTSRIGLGTWAIGGWMWGGTDEVQSIATIRSAVERGITLIDTAPAYGFGHSEEIVGKALAEGLLRDSRPRSAWHGKTAHYSATPGPRGFARKSKIHCAGCARTTLTFIRCTGLTSRRRLRKRRERSRISATRVRSVRSE